MTVLPSRRVYNIHRLVEVVVEEGISARIVRTLDDQIGYFLARGEDPNVTHRLRIVPYRDFPRSPGERRLQTRPGAFDTVHGIDFPREGWALEIGELEITLYVSLKAPPINPYLQLLLEPQGVGFVHAAAVEREGRVYIFPGYDGVGKTVLVGALMQMGGFRFLSDDISCLRSNGTCMAFPRRLILFPYHKAIFPTYFKQHAGSIRSQRMGSAAKRFVNQNMPLRQMAKRVASRLGVDGWLRGSMSAPEYAAAVPPEEMFGPEAVATEGRVVQAIFMQRYDGDRFDVHPMSVDDLSLMLVPIIHHIWVDYWEPVLLASTTRRFDLTTHYHRAADTVTQALKESSAVQLLIPHKTTIHQLGEKVRELLE